MKIKVHALYDHFPELTPKDNEKYIECYADMNIMECKEPGKNIAILLEPKSMIGEAYDYCRQHSDYFRYIFTHDSELLKLPNAKLLMWANVWLQTDSEKNKQVSIVTSKKNWCPLHLARIELAYMLNNKDKVDVFWGDWKDGKATFEPKDYLEHYKFSVIMENDIDDYWYTEKILNCFATKTVPIYVGSPKITEFFNGDGIIIPKDYHCIPKLIDELDIDAEYEKRLDAINDNFNRIEPYKPGWKERFFRDYGEILEDLYNE